MDIYGLIGFPLTHSFSPRYFNDKFEKEKLSNVSYRLFELSEISQLPELIFQNPSLKGFNVTIPYKELVQNFVDELDSTAKKTGSVNCVKVESKNGSPYLIGYNTDVYGFEMSLVPMLESYHKNALILGSGGSAKAVAFVLEKINIEYVFVSRNQRTAGYLNYDNITADCLKEHKLIINTTPLGMFPETGSLPSIPYEYLSNRHFLFDLVYNPSETLFLRNGKTKGALVKNGHEMFQLQADKSWEIWNR